MTTPTEQQPSPAASTGIKSDRASGLVLVALAGYILWLNRKFPVGSLADPGPGYVPMLLAIGLGVIGLLIVVLGGRSRPLAAIRWVEATRAVIILAACIVAGLVLEHIGYRITIFAFLVFFIGVIERRPPLPVLLVSGGFSLGSYYIIGDVLHVPLPVGPWGF